jgi:hypothetical protein
LRIKQVLHSVSKEQLHALLGGLIGTSHLHTGSVYKSGISSEFTEKYSESSSSYQ